MLKKVAFGVVIVVAATLGIIFIYLRTTPLVLQQPVVLKTPQPRPLLVYSLANLRQTKFTPVTITLGRKVAEDEDTVSQMFYFEPQVRPGSAETKKVSGLMNVPKKPGKYPVIIMFRGYAPLAKYFSGIGTQPAARVLSRNGFITIAPDFLGYGESDEATTDPYEKRFQTYTTALSLLASVNNLNQGMEASYSGSITADLAHIGIWGHSNGGHIALTVLGISQVTYPAVLWAPVSKSFPYSVLYYTDEDNDQGKAQRQGLAAFESLYDADDFSPPTVYDNIKAPLQLHQGTTDIEVPVWWSDELAYTLKHDKIKVDYQVHPGADHNLRPSGWSVAMSQTLAFYQEQFGGKNP